MYHERLINPLCHLLGQRNRGGIREMGHAQVRPRPLDSLFDQPGTNGIAQHITQDSQEMAVLLNGKNFEAPLPHMPMTPVVPMVAADMTGHSALHKAAQCSDCGWLHNQVKMIWHQTVAQHVDGMFGFRRGEQVEESGVVAIFMKDHGTAVPTIEHVVSVVGDLTARNTWHEGLE